MNIKGDNYSNFLFFYILPLFMLKIIYVSCICKWEMLQNTTEWFIFS